MKKLCIFLIFSLLLINPRSFGEEVRLETISNISIWFSPKGGITDAIIKEIKAATMTISVQAYSFTSEPIANALIEANKRGIKIELILDKGQRKEKYSQAKKVADNGIFVLIDKKHSIAHNKIIIIDEKIVVTGSFNFSKNAELNNAENLIIIKSADIARIYSANYLKHKEHSESF